MRKAPSFRRNLSRQVLSREPESRRIRIGNRCLDKLGFFGIFSVINKILPRIFLIAIALLALTPADINIAGYRAKNPMAGETIKEVLKKHTTDLMSMPGVVGTGQGLCEGKPCIKVFVIEKTPDLDQKIPKTLDGYPVVIEETGKFKALPKK
jgi:hypothetical protein